MTCFRAFWMWL